MTRTQRRVHILIWMVLGPALLLAVLLSSLGHGPGAAVSGEGAEIVP